MHFTKPTAKSYIYDAHLSQQEMLQMLMRDSVRARNSSTGTLIAMKPYNTMQWNHNRLEMMESFYRAIACIVLMLPLPPDAAYMVEVASESQIYWQLKDQHGKGNVINQVHVYDDDGDEIITTPTRI